MPGVYLLEREIDSVGALGIQNQESANGVVILLELLVILRGILFLFRGGVFGLGKRNTLIAGHSLDISLVEFSDVHNIIRFEFLYEVLAGEIHAMVFLHPGF